MRFSVNTWDSFKPTRTCKPSRKMATSLQLRDNPGRIVSRDPSSRTLQDDNPHRIVRGIGLAWRRGLPHYGRSPLLGKCKPETVRLLREIQDRKKADSSPPFPHGTRDRVRNDTLKGTTHLPWAETTGCSPSREKRRRKKQIPAGSPHRRSSAFEVAGRNRVTPLEERRIFPAASLLFRGHRLLPD